MFIKMATPKTLKNKSVFEIDSELNLKNTETIGEYKKKLLPE